MNGSSKARKRIHYLFEGVIEKSAPLKITVCHHSANLVMRNGEHWNRFFYPTLKLMIDLYNIQYRQAKKG